MGRAIIVITLWSLLAACGGPGGGGNGFIIPLPSDAQSDTAVDSAGAGDSDTAGSDGWTGTGDTSDTGGPPDTATTGDAGASDGTDTLGGVDTIGDLPTPDADICGNGVDDDLDGATDCADLADCFHSDASCNPTGAPPGSVRALQLAAEAYGCNPNGETSLYKAISLSGVIVTSPKYDAYTATSPDGTSLDGYFVQDPGGGPWSGLSITVSRDAGSNFAPGEVLDLEGTAVEFFCRTQLEVSGWTARGSGTAPSPASLLPAAATSEQHEGSLLSVGVVQVLSEPTGGVYEVTGGLRVSYGFPFFLDLEIGQEYVVTGQLDWSFGAWALLPRSPADVVPMVDASSTTIHALQQSTASLGCATDGIQTFDTGLELTGVVTVGRHVVSATLDGVYVSEMTPGPYAGLIAVFPDAMAGGFDPGDRVRIVGAHEEYYCNTQIKAVIIEKTSSGAAPPAIAMTGSELMSDPERFEGVRVEISSPFVTDASRWATYGDLRLDSGLVLDSSIMPSNHVTTTPYAGLGWTWVRGTVRFAFGSYRVAPASGSDYGAPFTE